MREQILESDFNKAVEELKGFFVLVAGECKQRGWDYYTTKYAPESFQDLKGQSQDKVIPIADYGSDTSIYGKEFNSLFRFYHDVTHLENDWTFSKRGETLTVEQHQRDANRLGLSALAKRILWADTYGQVEYYFKNRRFVENQLDFVWMCLQVGINKACRIRI